MTICKLLVVLGVFASLLSCGSSGLSPSADSGTLGKTGAWTQLNTGLPANADVTGLAGANSKLYALTNEGSNNFYVSTDSGASWTHATGDLAIPGQADKVGISAFALSGTSIFAGAGLLFTSTNDGQNWKVVNDTLGNSIIYTMVSVLGPDLFVGTIGGVLVSHNSGGTWATTQTSDGSGGNTPWVDGIPSTMTSSGATYLVGVSLGKSAWSSSDHGDHWAMANTGLPPGAGGAGGASVTAFATHGNVLLAGAGGHGIYRSIDNGSHWVESDTGFFNPSDALGPTTAYAFAVAGNTIYAGTDSGVYVSVNDGLTWAKLDRADLPDFTAVYSMAVMGSNLYIGTYTSGVWRHALP